MSDVQDAPRVAIVQSNYIPWKGYFDLISQVDCFVLYDDMQYTRRDWRNRNKIKRAKGADWLTIPVQVKGKYYQAINQTQVADGEWADKHWQKIVEAYRNTPYFEQLKFEVEAWYQKAAQLSYLSDINQLFIVEICKLMGIATQILDSRQFQLVDGKSERLLGVCKDLNAAEYVSGPAAKDYLDEQLFTQQNIKVHWMDYGQYPQYPQLFGDFTHGVSILDVMFNCGAECADKIFSQQAWGQDG